MKIIEQVAKEYAETYVPTTGYDKFDAPYITRFEHNSDVGEAFKDGARFAQRWIPVDKKLPLCYESGDWDGLRSDFVLIKDKYNNWTKGILYSGIIDGHNFNDWYSVESIEMPIVTHWRPIELE